MKFVRNDVAEENVTLAGEQVATQVATQVVQQDGLELFKSTMELELKRFEKRKSGENQEYVIFYFDTCVRFNPDNQRDNRYLLVPLYSSMETATRCLGGKKDILNKRYRIDVVFTPSLFKSKNGEMFANFRAEIEELELLENQADEPF